MKLSDILVEANVIAALTAPDKLGVLRELAEHLTAHNALGALSTGDVQAALLEREHLGSTGVGQGVAIPHARLPNLAQLVAVFGRSPGGIEFDAIDQQPVSLFFMLLVPESSAGVHLKALSRIARLLKNDDFRRRLNTLADRPSLYHALTEEDALVGP